MNAEIGQDGYPNVPISIYHTKTGQKIGSLPRAMWVNAQHGATANYRNLEDAPMSPDGKRIPGNVEKQTNLLLQVREKIADAFNAGKGQTFKSTVDSVSGGHIFYNTNVNKNSYKYNIEPKTAKTLIPGEVRFGIINNATVFVGSNTPLEGKKNFDEDRLNKRFGKSTEQNNLPVVILPMANGGWDVSPLFSKSLGDRPAQINTIARAIEAYLAYGTDQFTPQHERVVKAIAEATTHEGTHSGFNITNEEDLEAFINQYFTYTQHFEPSHTYMSAGGLQRFKLDIPSKLPGQIKSSIKVGVMGSNIQPVYASLVDGKLEESFENSLVEGLKTHTKNVVYSRGKLRGINDSDPFNAIIIREDGTPRVDKYKNYNEYAKTFLNTVVYGHHKIGADGKPVEAKDPGTYVYGANPVITFDPSQILTDKLLAEPDKSAIGSDTVPKDSELNKDIASEMMRDLFTSGAYNPDSKPVITDRVGPIEDGKLATLSNLITLQQNTPAEKRNGKSPQDALDEMHYLGIIEISPLYNPFLKC
jgi:hypothetical protein